MGKLKVKEAGMAGEPTAALHFTGVQRAASVGAPPTIPAQLFRLSGYTVG